MIVIMMASMLTMEFLPKVPYKVFKIIPSSLCSIIVAIFLEFVLVRPTGFRTDTIGDVSKFTSDTAYPCPFFINSPGREYDLGSLGTSEGMGTILQQGFLLCVVGTIESLMTSEVVESFVKTPSDGRKTVLAMGLGNLMSGFMGGMGGNAMIGLSTINVLNGGKGRVSPTVTALVVFAACVGAYPLLNFIPVAALAGIMIVVVLHTFKWFSLLIVINLLPSSLRSQLPTWIADRKIPRVEAIVIVVVTLVSIFANIAYSVIAGVCICSVAFAWNAAQQLVYTTEYPEDNLKVYHVEGPIYFTTANKLLKVFDVDNDPENVEVVFGYSSLMDYTAINTLNRLAVEYKGKEKSIKFMSLNECSKSLVVKANQLVSQITMAEARAIVEKHATFEEPAEEEIATPKKDHSREHNGFDYQNQQVLLPPPAIGPMTEPVELVKEPPVQDETKLLGKRSWLPSCLQLFS